MELENVIGGSAPWRKRYQITATQTVVGIPYLQPAAGNAGTPVGTTTACDNLVGISLDTAVFVTAQQTDGSSAERTVSLVINPGALWQAKFTGGAASNTTLAQRTVSTASTDGLVITTGDDWGSPEYDEGVIWGFDGANAEQFRKITSTGATAATVTVAFDSDTVIGDNFLFAPLFEGQPETVTLSTELDQVRADVAVASNTAAFRCVELRLLDKAGDGDTSSFAILLSSNHVYGGVLG